ncbi:MAG: hypothetical protein GXZ11_06240 [Tissierellia bacterium]|nr:hypothetical protein [Tissierellia bacterium]
MKKKRILFAVFTIIISILLASCTKDTTWKGIYIENNPISPLENVMRDAIKDEEINKTIYSELYSHLNDKNSGIVAIEDKVRPIIKYYNYYPLYRETVVIAVNRDLYKGPVKTWSDVLEADGKVFFSGSRREVMGSIACALGKDKPDYNSAIKYLKRINDNQKFVLDYNEEEISGCQILFLMDHEAANLILKGYNLEIIVPTDGTLYVNRGLIAPKVIELDSNKMEKELVKHGFRLIDGTYNHKLFGDLDYSNAVSLTPYVQMVYKSNMLGTEFSRQVLSEGTFGPIEGTETIILHICIIIFSMMWGTFTYGRIINENVRKNTLITSILMAFWSTVKLLKYISNKQYFFNRTFWYLYYVPIIMICILSFWTSLLVDKEMDNSKLKVIKNWTFSTGVVVLFLILTNDFHSLIFDWSFSEGVLIYKYTKLFRWILLWEILGIAVPMWIMYTKAKQLSGKKKTILPLIVGLSMMIYILLYITGRNRKISIDVTFTSAIAVITMLELLIRIDLIPTNEDYEKVFNKSSINMKITDKDGLVIYASEDVDSSSNKEEMKHRINGGYAVYYKDVEEITRLNKSIEDIINKLNYNYNKLRKEYDVREELAALLAREKIAGLVENIIEGELMSIDKRLQALDKHKEGVSEELAEISFDITKIKQISNLLMIELIKGEIKLSDMVISIDALSKSAARLGVEMDIFYNEDAYMNYNEIHYCIHWLAICIKNLSRKQASILVNIVSRNNQISINLIVDSKTVGIEELVVDNIWKAEFASILYYEDDDELRASLKIQRGERND